VSLYGFTMYPLTRDRTGHERRGSSWALPTFPSYIDNILNLARSARLNTVRPTDYLDGSANWTDPVVWSNMDYLLSAARRRHMFVILDISVYRTWLQRHDVWPYNPSDWTPFLRFVGQRYTDAPALACYAIAGEIPAPRSATMPWNATAEQFVRFFGGVSAQLYAYDGGHHLISTGGLSYLNFDSGIPWQSLFSLPHIDMAAVHIYSPQDRATTMPMVASWARARRTPFVVEEFGFQQSMGDHARADAFAAMYTAGARYRASAMIFWNIGPEVASDSYDVNPRLPRVWRVVQRYAPTMPRLH